MNGNSRTRLEVTILGAAALEKHVIEVWRLAISQALPEI